MLLNCIVGLHGGVSMEKWSGDSIIHVAPP